jgi:hypothetical protein
VHRRAPEIAERRGISLSAVMADLTVRGLSQLDEPMVISTDERRDLPL